MHTYILLDVYTHTSSTHVYTPISHTCIHTYILLLRCPCIHTYICIHTDICVHTYLYTHISVYTHNNLVYTHIFYCACVCVRVHGCICICEGKGYVHVYVYVYGAHMETHMERDASHNWLLKYKTIHGKKSMEKNGGFAGVHRAGEGKWASCIRVLDPVERQTVQLISLDEDEAALCLVDILLHQLYSYSDFIQERY